MKKSNKRILWIIAAILIVVLIAGFVVGFYYISIMKKTLEQVTTVDGSKTILSVYVWKDDPAKSIGDTVDYPYGISLSGEKSGILEQAAAKLEEQLNRKPDIREYENLFALADGLQSQDCRAVVLHESYLESLAEAEGYEWVPEGFRKIGSFELNEMDDEGADLEVPDNIPESFVMYISGIDTFGGIKARSRSDVNILAAVNTKTKQVQMISTPRDSYVDFSATKGKKDKLTHAGIYGVEASIDALERLYGIGINYYLRINFSGFVNVIDALGGVEVYSDYDFTVKDIKEYHKGYNQLTGIEALAFARERYSFARGDYQRAKNQMEVIRAVILKCSTTAVLKNYRAVMEAIGGSFETNMPENQILSLVKMQLSDQGQWNVSTYTTEGAGASKETYSMPGRNLYVVLLNQDSIKQAKEMLEKVQNP